MRKNRRLMREPEDPKYYLNMGRCWLPKFTVIG